MLLRDLPPEVHHEIVSHLELPALVKIAATNHHFQEVIKPWLGRETLQAYEKANPHTVMLSGKRPCHGCLRMRNDDDFYTTTGWDPPFDVSVLWKGVCVHFAADDTYLARRCFECDDQARFRLGRNLKPGVINGLTWPVPVVPAGNGSATAGSDTAGATDGLNGLVSSTE